MAVHPLKCMFLGSTKSPQTERLGHQRSLLQRHGMTQQPDFCTVSKPGEG